MSYVFNYSAIRRTVSTIGFSYWEYAISPATTLPPTDAGAVAVDFRLFKGLRASDLPMVNIPPSLPTGPGDTWDGIQRQVSSNLLPMVGLPARRTLPGLLNWSFIPSIIVVYEGKQYTLYNGESITAQFSDGTTVTFEVQVSNGMLTTGYLIVKKITPPVSPPNLAPPSAGSLSGTSTFNPSSIAGVPVYLYAPVWTSTRSGSVFVGEIMVANPNGSGFSPFTFEFDIG